MAAGVTTATPPIRLLLSDVDGTLVTSEKALAASTIDAIARLGEAGIAFAVTSGRPPLGMSMLIEPLAISTPIAGFNGGRVVDTSMTLLRELTIPDALLAPVRETLTSHDLDVWVFHGTDWYVRDLEGTRVSRERRATRIEPRVVDSFDHLRGHVAKIVGVSADHDAIAAACVALRTSFGADVAASSSSPYYLDVTHPQANKGEVVVYLSAQLDIPSESVATIGDMPNDIFMFERSGMSIAMGNGAAEAQAAADHVTGTNDADGFADAIERHVLPRAPELVSEVIVGRDDGVERFGPTT